MDQKKKGFILRILIVHLSVQQPNEDNSTRKQVFQIRRCLSPNLLFLFPFSINLNAMLRVGKKKGRKKKKKKE